ncbi:MAG: NADH-quinone oxidoreductase subunit J [Planctomycetia bacterium]|nr:NADH-quinone oxidoreductase subunit J [Planctomycetia bacterium]
MHPINWHTAFFMLYAVVACTFGVAVVVSSNIVRMALYLIVSLGATAGLFFLAGADFVGAMQLFIYVGGTLVLLIFGVMLTAKGPFISMRTSGGDWIVAVLLSGCLMALLVPAAFSVASWRNERHAAVDAEPDDSDTAVLAAPRTVAAAHQPAATEEPPAPFIDDNGDGIPDVQPKTATALGLGLLGARVDAIDAKPEMRPGMSGYLLPFELISVHLLVVLIGAAYLARAKRRVR